MSGMLQELVTVGRYKKTQGKIARQVTFAALALTVVLGCFSMSEFFVDSEPLWLFRYVIPYVCCALPGLWVCYRVVNMPRFADFLIAVEAEMNKVNWPSRRELFRASMVVLVTIFVLAIVLYVYDLMWYWVLMDALDIGGIAGKKGGG